MSYIPDLLAGNSLLDVVQLQSAMFSFHSGSSVVQAQGLWDNAWWSWPLVLKPLWLAVSYNPPNGLVSTIMLLGNPAVWWVGFACIITLLAMLVPGQELVFRLRGKLAKKEQVPEAEATLAVNKESRRWDLAAVFIVVIFFFQWVPYMLISRITYIYHFYVNVPILCLASAYFLNKIWDKKYGKLATVAYLAIVVLVFVLFYAVISGMPTSRDWIDSLKLFGNTWLQP
jgi:dolichyl-phosphate-mannose-protein mannosyltransferase